MPTDDPVFLITGASSGIGAATARAAAGFRARRGFLEETPERWRSMVLTNVLGVALTIRASLEALEESRGHILLTSSVAGRRALAGSLGSASRRTSTSTA